MIIVRSGRHPHEVIYLASCVLIGLAGLIAPGAVTTTTLGGFGPWFVGLWYAGLLVGGGIALIGVCLKSLLGPVCERAGLWVLSGLCLAYGVAVLSQWGTRGLMFGVFVVGFSAANFVRIYQITTELRQVTDHLGRSP